jgi:hypothetical protein
MAMSNTVTPTQTAIPLNLVKSWDQVLFAVPETVYGEQSVAPTDAGANATALFVHPGTKFGDGQKQKAHAQMRPTLTAIKQLYEKREPKATLKMSLTPSGPGPNFPGANGFPQGNIGDPANPDVDMMMNTGFQRTAYFSAVITGPATGLAGATPETSCVVSNNDNLPVGSLAAIPYAAANGANGAGAGEQVIRAQLVVIQSSNSSAGNTDDTITWLPPLPAGCAALAGQRVGGRIEYDPLPSETVQSTPNSLTLWRRIAASGYLEVMSGCAVSKLQVEMPNNDHCTMQFDLVGKDHTEFQATNLTTSASAGDKTLYVGSASSPYAPGPLPFWMQGETSLALPATITLTNASVNPPSQLSENIKITGFGVDPSLGQYLIIAGSGTNGGLNGSYTLGAQATAVVAPLLPAPAIGEYADDPLTVKGMCWIGPSATTYGAAPALSAANLTQTPEYTKAGIEINNILESVNDAADHATAQGLKAVKKRQVTFNQDGKLLRQAPFVSSLVRGRITSAVLVQMGNQPGRIFGAYFPKVQWESSAEIGDAADKEVPFNVKGLAIIEAGDTGDQEFKLVFA